MCSAGHCSRCRPPFGRSPSAAGRSERQGASSPTGAAITAPRTNPKLGKLKSALRHAEQDRDEGDFDECSDAIDDAKQLLKEEKGARGRDLAPAAPRPSG